MHPVVSSEFRTIGRQQVCVSAVCAVVIPTNSLHVGTEVAIVARHVYAQELAVSAVRFFCGYSRSRCLERSVFDTGICSCLSSREAEGTVLVHCRCLQAVRSLCDLCRRCIRDELIFSIAAYQSAVVLYYIVFCCERFIICRLYFYGNILNTRDLVMIHCSCCPVSLCDSALAEAYRAAVCQRDSRTVFAPVRNCIGISICIIDSSHHLEAASVQTVVCRCTSNCIECSLVIFASSICFFRRSRGACCINAFRRPILRPGQTGVYIRILVFCHFFLNRTGDCRISRGFNLYRVLRALFRKYGSSVSFIRNSRVKVYRAVLVEHCRPEVIASQSCPVDRYRRNILEVCRHIETIRHYESIVFQLDVAICITRAARERN